MEKSPKVLGEISLKVIDDDGTGRLELITEGNISQIASLFKYAAKEDQQTRLFAIKMLSIIKFAFLNSGEGNTGGKGYNVTRDSNV